MPRLVIFAFAAVLAAIGLGLRSDEVAAAERLRFVLVTHGAAADPFWATVRDGALEAAGEMDATVEYRAPATFDLDAMAKLVEAAVAERPDGLIVSVPDGDKLAAPIRAAVDAKIPVVTINSGFDVGVSLGALLHVGQSEYEAGRAAGEKMRDLGGTKALCLNHERGNVALDLRCKGFIDGFAGTVEVQTVEPDAAKAGPAIAAMLADEPDVDVVLALSASISGDAAVAAARALRPGRTVRVASFDLTPTLLRAVADDTASFAVDQQPFLQGYLPVQYLALYLRRDLVPVSNVSTGPRIVAAAEARRQLAATTAAETPAQTPPGTAPAAAP